MSNLKTRKNKFVTPLTSGSKMGELEDPGNGNSFGSMPSVSIVGLVVSIVVCAVLCFAVGLIVHKLYRRHRKKRVRNGISLLLYLFTETFNTDLQSCPNSSYRQANSSSTLTRHHVLTPLSPGG